jgi:hypothetical protein
VSALNTTVKKREGVERSYIQCGTFSKEWKSLKYLHLEELESVESAVAA